MDDLKSVTLGYLRNLARKHLGPGHSKLTKKQLIAALAEFVPALKKLAKLAGIELPKKEPEPKKEPKPQAASPAPAKAEEASQSAKTAQVVNFPPRPRTVRSAEEEWADVAVRHSPELDTGFQHAAEPLVEGFFVARLMGERELRRHHLTEEQAPRSRSSVAPGYEEGLGELPLDYGNDLALALARNPHTLFITWDFSAASQARAVEGLEEPRAMLRVFDGERVVREMEVALASRSFYIHGLPAGRPYRVEAHFIGREGRSQRIGASTHALALPRMGPSQDTTVRFMQMPPPPQVPVIGSSPVLAPVPVPEAVNFTPPLEASGQPAPKREYITWRRTGLPGSDEMASVAESRSERTARQREERPGKPQHLEGFSRPLGSSDVTHWTPPPSGRGR